MQVQFFPMVDDSLHLIGEIETPEILIFAMSGEDCCGKRTNLIAHIGKNRDGNGERGSPITG